MPLALPQRVDLRQQAPLLMIDTNPDNGFKKTCQPVRIEPACLEEKARQSKVALRRKHAMQRGFHRKDTHLAKIQMYLG